jgi:hypothetical protein
VPEILRELCRIRSGRLKASGESFLTHLLRLGHRAVFDNDGVLVVMTENRPTKRWNLLYAAAMGGGISLIGIFQSLINDQSSLRWTLKYGNPAEAGGMLGAVFFFPLIFVVGAFVRNSWHNVRDDGYGRWHSVLRFAFFFILCTVWCLGVVFAASLSYPYESVLAYFLSVVAQLLGFVAGGWVLAWLTGLLRTQRQPSPVQLSSG